MHCMYNLVVVIVVVEINLNSIKINSIDSANYYIMCRQTEYKQNSISINVVWCIYIFGKIIDSS